MDGGRGVRELVCDRKRGDKSAGRCSQLNFMSVPSEMRKESVWKRAALNKLWMDESGVCG